ncbi:hypothetical protein BW687_006870 [Pseudomonas graminis]|uniref:hypothetical protein n=1 Tax=Pseudomonas graminis TaxID=158627 RepID=UPI00234A6C7C|nr:hypothetical protein [Pseudomonas graminis]MDC6379902.1 hypothetical protein [Pseudomonas graminis]
MNKHEMLNRINTIHTLGPAGTNCEIAAARWLERHNPQGTVVLHPTLEDGVKAIGKKSDHALLACIAYPELHTLMFENLTNLSLADCLITPTFDMVFATRPGLNSQDVKTVATHRAPQHLAPKNHLLHFVDSNAAAALSCRDLEVEGCITTSAAAAQYGLMVLQNHGPIEMGFSIHCPRI